MLTVQPSRENGLTQLSEVNAAQIMTVDRSRLVTLRGHLSERDMALLAEKIAYTLSLTQP